ncbi:MAG: A/G-specific adenine glycosylase [Planctomycetes bacterium]|nr:A/G-specific adenine glycosylase [Planctomycetota bacterium]
MSSHAKPSAKPALPRPEALRKSLLGWYARAQRDLPWRRNPRLYPVLLSEFMLQQTRVDQALPYYARFLQRFPTLKDLAAADLGAVMKLWEGLGYYRRAGFLHETAKRLAPVQEPGVAELAECPGIGPYTLAAIGSIVWGARLPVVDGNVNRVLARLLALEDFPQSKAGKAAILARLQEWIPEAAPGDWNQGLMELGATVCTPHAPKCGACPWQAFCSAHALGRVEDFPKVEPKAARPHKHAAAAVIRRKDGRILVAQRPAQGLLANLWEFPGGLLLKEETRAAGCARAVREQLGVEIRVDESLATVEHGFSHFTLTLHFFSARHLKGAPEALRCQAWNWLKPSELRRLPFPRAHWPVLEKLAPEAK